MGVWQQTGHRAMKTQITAAASRRTISGRFLKSHEITSIGVHGGYAVESRVSLQGKQEALDL